MQIVLTAYAQLLLQRHLESGAYGSAAEVIEQALDLLDQQQPSLASFKTKLQVGLNEIANGLVSPLDVADIKRRGRERLTGHRTGA